MTPEQCQQAIRGMVEGLASRLKDNPQDRAGWLRLANAWKVLGEHANAINAYARADALAPVDARLLADWAEAHVRQLKPGGAAAFASGDKKAAAERWKTLLAMLPADAPIRAMLEERIREAEGVAK